MKTIPSGGVTGGRCKALPSTREEDNMSLDRFVLREPKGWVQPKKSTYGSITR